MVTRLRLFSLLKLLIRTVTRSITLPVSFWEKMKIGQNSQVFFFFFFAPAASAVFSLCETTRSWIHVHEDWEYLQQPLGACLGGLLYYTFDSTSKAKRQALAAHSTMERTD